jgi:hypothetical protein
VGFPTLALPDAAEAVRRAAKYGTVHSESSLAGHLGHKTTNSGPFKQKLAALRDWGLIAGKGDQLSLTETGLAIALPTNPESEAAALRTAFFNSDVFAKTYQAVSKNIALDRTTLGNTAVRNQGVAPTSKDDFVKSLTASAITAGLAEAVDETKVQFLVGVPAVEAGLDSVPEDVRHAADRPSLQRGEARASTVEYEARPVLRQVWPTEYGQVILEIRSSRPLLATEFAQIGKVVAECQHLADQMAGGDPGVTG